MPDVVRQLSWFAFGNHKTGGDIDRPLFLDVEMRQSWLLFFGWIEHRHEDAASR